MNPEFISAVVFPSIGVVLSCALYASSFPTVQWARRHHTPDALDHTTLTMQLLNCVSWMVYAILAKDLFVWWSNMPGLMLTLFYVSTILTLAGEKGHVAVTAKVERILGMGIFCLLMEICTIAFGITDAADRQLLAGLMANTFTALMFLAPTLNVAQAIRERSAAAFVVPLVIVTLLNCSMWVGYGLLAKKDPFIYVPNAVGVVTALIQSAVIVLFGRSKDGRRVSLAEHHPISPHDDDP
eukprot:EG_transcript_26436